MNKLVGHCFKLINGYIELDVRGHHRRTETLQMVAQLERFMDK